MFGALVRGPVTCEDFTEWFSEEEFLVGAYEFYSCFRIPVADLRLFIFYFYVESVS